jgi:hypothetical protein
VSLAKRPSEEGSFLERGEDFLTSPQSVYITCPVPEKTCFSLYRI